MAPNKSSLNKIKIVGLISEIPYHRAKLCVQKLHECLPEKFDLPEIRGMLEVDWDEYITAQRRLHGGLLWALIRPVAVYYNDSFIGSDVDLFEELSIEYKFYLPTAEDFYKKTVYLDYVNFLKKSKRVYCYMDIEIDNVFTGTLTFQLYSELLPETCENFRCICTGEMEKDENGIELNYKDSQIHRIVKTCWIQGGDIQNKTGGGGAAILSSTFPDESYCINHDRRGVLSMANDGKHTNASQFFVTLQPMQWMDYYYVAFGQLVEGVEVLKAIEAVETYYEKPKKCIRICDCGMITFEEKEINVILNLLKSKEETEDEWVYIEELPSDVTLVSLDQFAKTIVKDLITKATVRAPEDVSDISLGSLDQFAKTIVKDLITKATIRAPEDVLDMRDVQSFLDADRYFMGMYSIEWDPNLKFTTPEQFLNPQDLSPRCPGFGDEVEVIDDELEEFYYIDKTFSEGTLPVSLTEESSSNITLKSSDRTGKRILKELITKSIKISETGKRFVNMILNDSMRMVKICLNKKMNDPPEVLAHFAGKTRDIVNEIIGRAIFKLWPTDDDDSGESIGRRIVEELVDKALVECSSEEDIVNQVVTDLITRVVVLLHPSLDDVALSDSSALEMGKILFSDIVTEATKDISVILGADATEPSEEHEAVVETSETKKEYAESEKDDPKVENSLEEQK